ncbi:MAG: hypothetical protein QOJ91_2739 [Sphingomonadales bacterium]|jgi:hypothetical protein|nr:hypothetical protein [Sphingomonadales bacterium]
MTDAPILKVVLCAGGVEVATSSDSKIWLATMAMITGNAPPEVAGVHKDSAGRASQEDQTVHGPKGLRTLAQEIGVPFEELVAACSPSEDKPFIILEHRNWEALKSNTALRGPGSIAGTVLAATLLLLWGRHANVGKVNTSACNAVLEKIGHSERNQARSLRNCEWLQVRDEGVRLNPARVETAKKIARAYILRTPIE